MAEWYVICAPSICFSFLSILGVFSKAQESLIYLGIPKVCKDQSLFIIHVNALFAAPYFVLKPTIRFYTGCLQNLHFLLFQYPFALLRMGECEIPGHDMFYGIGIRIGFYLQYISFIWAGHVKEHDLAERAAGALALWLFKFGAMVALLHDIIVTKYLEASEIYVVLLLLLRIPILRMIGLLFDLFTCAPQPRMSRDDVSDSIASLALLIIDVGISAWFWIAGFQVRRSTISCTQVGFLFAKIDLASQWFRIVNLVCLFVFFLAALFLGARRVYVGIKQRRNRPK